MKKFEFYIDRLTQGWEREHYIIEAENEEKAKSEILEIFEGQEFGEPDVCETLYDTFFELTPDENHGNSTRELYHDNGELIKQNGL